MSDNDKIPDLFNTPCSLPTCKNSSAIITLCIRCKVPLYCSTNHRLHDKGRHQEECVEAAHPAPERPPEARKEVTVRAILFSTTRGGPCLVNVRFGVLHGKWQLSEPFVEFEALDRCLLLKDPKGQRLDKPLEIYYREAFRDKASPPNEAISGWIKEKHPYNVWGGSVLAFKRNANLQGYSEDDFDSADLAVLLDLIRTNKPSAPAGAQPQPSPPTV